MLNLFIAWSGERSRFVAETLYDWLPKVIKVKPWMSDYDIFSGERWFEKILKGLKSSGAGIICLTRENYDSPWLLFEAGALASCCKKERIVPFLLDIKPKELMMLNHPLYLYEAQGYNRKNVFKMIQHLNNIIKPSVRKSSEILEKDFLLLWPKLREKLNPISKSSLFPDYLIDREKIRIRETPGCKGLDLTLMATNISDSTFGYLDLIKNVKKRILIAGQNLYYLSGEESKKKEKDRRKEIFTALKKNIKVDIMICDTNAKEALETWGNNVMQKKQKYVQHLKYSTRTFREWVRQSKRSNLNGLTVKTTSFIPLSITFVDPEDDNNGRLVITTATYDRKENRLRPCYYISQKEHSVVFRYYWEAYRGIFEDTNARCLR